MRTNKEHKERMAELDHAMELQLQLSKLLVKSITLTATSLGHVEAGIEATQRISRRIDELEERPNP